MAEGARRDVPRTGRRIQIEAANVLAKFPRLVGQRKLRTSADPFVISLARVAGLKIVTDEKPTGSLDRPNIPDVCTAMGVSCIGLLDVIRAEKWVIGKGTDKQHRPFQR